MRATREGHTFSARRGGALSDRATPGSETRRAHRPKSRAVRANSRKIIGTGRKRGGTVARMVAAITDRDHTPPISGWAAGGGLVHRRDRTRRLGDLAADAARHDPDLTHGAGLGPGSPGLEQPAAGRCPVRVSSTCRSTQTAGIAAKAITEAVARRTVASRRGTAQPTPRRRVAARPHAGVPAAWPASRRRAV